MPKTKSTRSDKKKNKASVVKVLLQDPLKSTREVAKAAWVGSTTAHRVIKEMEQTGTKDPRILWVSNKDLQIVELSQAEMLRRLKSKTERKRIKIADLATIAEKSEKRRSLIVGNATDDQGWVKSILDQIID